MNSITAAKNRRTNPPPSQSSNTNTQPSTPSRTGQQPTPPNANSKPSLTLQQVIQITDLRLKNLETFVVEMKKKGISEVSTFVAHPQTTDKTVEDSTPSPATEFNINFQQNTETDDETKKTIETVVEEFDKRYDMLAEEIIHLKDIVLNLQSYTMDVNKLLMEERTRFMEEMEQERNRNGAADAEEETPNDEATA